MTDIFAWEIIPVDASRGLPGASLAEAGFVGLWTGPLCAADPAGPAEWAVETPDGDGGAVTLRAGVAASAERARAAAEAAAREVAAAVAALHATTETPSGLH